MVLDIMEIEYFFIVLNFSEVEYLVFFSFFYFLFRTKLLKVQKAESESFVFGLNN